MVVLLPAGLTSQAFRFFAKLLISIIAVGGITLWGLGRMFGPRTAKRILGTLALLGISIATSVVAAEIIVRYTFHDVTTPTGTSSYFAQRWNRNHPLTTNSWGFRERELTGWPKGKAYRIAVVGDSFTYGQGITEDARLTNILERRLNESTDGYQVLNFGRPGAETIDHLEFLDKHVFGVFPDYILLQWFINDMEGHDKFKRPNFWRLLPSEVLTSYLHRNSALYYLLDRQWRELQTKLGVVESYNDYFKKRFEDPETEDSRAAIDAEVENYPLGFSIDRVTETCRQEKISCLDLRPVFVHVSPASKLWANRLDAHPGRLANEMAADAVLTTFKTEWSPNSSNSVVAARRAEE
jgi:hypothetical protein